MTVIEHVSAEAVPVTDSPNAVPIIAATDSAIRRTRRSVNRLMTGMVQVPQGFVTTFWTYRHATRRSGAMQFGGGLLSQIRHISAMTHPRLEVEIGASRAHYGSRG
jgi:hypothetical protein